jgi:hypothetical protein
MTNQPEERAFTIQGDGSTITLAILRYENDAPETLSDANWLQAKVQFASDVCTFTSAAAIT